MGNTVSSNNRPLFFAISAGFVSCSSLLVMWFAYERINRATRLDNLRETNYNIEQLNTAIDTLRKEIAELKAGKSLKSNFGEVEEEFVPRKSGKVVRFKSSLSYLSSTSDADFHSAWSENESSSDEYFDFPENDEGSVNRCSNVCDSDVVGEPIELFDKVDSLLFEGSSAEDHESAHKLLMENEHEFQDNVEFLWRVAKACRIIAQDLKGSTKEKELSYEAIRFGKRAVEADSSSAEAHKWFAISVGASNFNSKINERIKNGILFKQHIDIAISINPTDHMLHHLLGRFSLEVSLLSWIERKVASKIFSEIPSGSVEEALACFTKAEELYRKWKTNSLYIARCFIQLEKYAQAMSHINDAISLPMLKAEDQSSHDELLTLAAKYRTYS